MYRRKRRAEQQVERHSRVGDRRLADRLAALDEVIAAGEGRLPDEPLAPARELHRPGRRAAADVRLAHRGRPGRGHRERQVLAVQRAGRVAAVRGRGAPADHRRRARGDLGRRGRRPAAGLAADPAPALPRLRRPQPDEGDHRLDGLVLLDLPDHDSTTVAHRVEVDRLVDLVDVLVWVLDPQKYADAAVHERYLRPLAGHAGVMVVVLNQADRLPPHQVDPRWTTCAGCSPPTGWAPVPVLATSAVAAGRAGRAARGAGRRGGRARGRAAPARRRSGRGGAGLARRVAGPARQALDRAAVVRADHGALPRPPGCPRVGTRRGPPGLPAPGRRPHGLAVPALAAPAAAGPAAPAAPGPHRRRRPPRRLRHRRSRSRRAVQRSRVDAALRALADHASEGLPDPWPDAVRAAARSRSADLSDALDRAVAGTDLGPTGKPAWWRAIGAAAGAAGRRGDRRRAVAGRAATRSPCCGSPEPAAADGRRRCRCPRCCCSAGCWRAAARAAGPAAGRGCSPAARGPGRGPAARGGRRGRRRAGGRPGPRRAGRLRHRAGRAGPAPAR